jgi:predicted dehydrogenase
VLPRLGFVGCGWIGRKRLGALLKQGIADIIGIVEPDENARAEASKMVPAAAVYSSYENLLAIHPDGIVLSTPNYLHAVQAERVLLSRIPVFCQKPIGLTAEETRRVIGAARKADCLISTDFCYRRTAGIAEIAALVESGELGDVYLTDLVFHNSYGPDKDWYYARTMAGGGCLLDLGIHLVDLALWIAGGESVKGCMSRLYCQGRHIDRESQLEDHAIASLDLTNGSHVSLSCSWRQRLTGDATIRAIFHGTKGLAVFENVSGSFYDFRAFAFANGVRQTLAEPPDDWEGRALIEWVTAITSNKGFDAKADSFVLVSEVLDLIYRSAKQFDA